MKRKLIILLCSIVMLYFMLPIEAIETKPTRVVNLVYDDSGSMYISDDGVLVDTWCQAKYSMEVFAGLLGETDTLNVYYMSDYRGGTTNKPRLVLRGLDGAAKNVAKLHNEKTKASNTPFNSVRKAYFDLTQVSADEKWLVILTDGAFEDGALSKSEVDAFLDKKDENINVMFLAMGAGATGITGNEAKNIYYVEAKTNSEILSHITGISNRIFNSNRLDVNASSKTFSFDVPMAELTVFAQGANVEINGIKTEEGRLIKSAKAPVGVKYSSCDAVNYNNPPATDLVGSIATYIDDFQAGNYMLDISGAETIEIFYKPNVEVVAYLTNSAGEEVTDIDNLEAGEYSLSFGFVKGGTKEKVNQSKLLGNVDYRALVTTNGSPHEKLYASGDKIKLEEGTLQIDVTAYYLDYNSVSTRLEYSVFRNKEVSFEIVNNPSYNIDSKGIVNKEEYVHIKAKIDGNEFTSEQWERLNIPTVMLTDDKRDFRIDNPLMEKTGQVGIFRLRPLLPKDKPSTGTYVDTGYKLEYLQQFEKGNWFGKTSGILKLKDNRSWWERNWDLFVKLIVILILLFILAGYLPIFKNYLPKSLKSHPYIKCIPNAPGTKRKDRTGVVEKNLFSTIIPYVSQRGTIKYVPRGVSGAPHMLVRAIKRRRMTLTNIKAFAGKDYITFDGETIKKDCKKFDTGAAVTIRIKRGEWTYECNPNQSGK